MSGEPRLTTPPAHDRACEVRVTPTHASERLRPAVHAAIGMLAPIRLAVTALRDSPVACGEPWTGLLGNAEVSTRWLATSLDVLVPLVAGLECPSNSSDFDAVGLLADAADGARRAGVDVDVRPGAAPLTALGRRDALVPVVAAMMRLVGVQSAVAASVVADRDPSRVTIHVVSADGRPLPGEMRWLGPFATAAGGSEVQTRCDGAALTLDAGGPR
jgi:hypothetical protein